MALYVVTGASRGLGRALVDAFAARDANARFMLVARSADALASLRGERTHVCIADLSTHDGIRTACSTLATRIDDERDAVSRVVLVNNAAALGQLLSVGALFDQHDDSADSNKAGDGGAERAAARGVPSLAQLAAHDRLQTLNITAPLALCSTLLARAPATHALHVANVSSLAAIEPFPSWGEYCTTKAACEMLHRLLAKECEARRNVFVLNYSPGVMDTAMQREVRDNATDNTETQQYMRGLQKQGKLVQPRDSADALARLLDERKLASGAHVDYYDVAK